RSEHPNLVKIFTSGADGGHWFYAMELVEGATLAAVCERLQSDRANAAGLDLESWQQALSTVCDAARQAEQPLSGSRSTSPPRPPGEAPPPRTAPNRAGRNYVRHVVELMSQVSDAAHALHEVGVVHRDIKPGNIMVSTDGTEAVLMAS